MQIFGSAVLPFTTTNQGIITQGVATFLNSGVTASQIVLTVENTIAGVRDTPSCFVDCQDGILQFCSESLLGINFDVSYEHFCMACGPNFTWPHVDACRQFAKVESESCIKNIKNKNRFRPAGDDSTTLLRRRGQQAGCEKNTAFNACY